MAGEIFISYRRADQAWARLLHAQLRAEGIEAWYDAQVGAGQDWRIATAKALEASQIFVLLFSSNAAQSSDIAKELAAATLEKKLIIPVRLENIAPKGAFLYELASRNWVNAYENTEAKLAELSKGLAYLVRTGARDESVLPFDRSEGGEHIPAPPKKSLPKPVLIAAAAIVMVAAVTALFWMYSRPASFTMQRWTVESTRPFISTLALEGEPTFSPDGKMLAYTSGKDTLSRKIYVRNLAGGDGIKITSDAFDDISPRWSSDGARIAYVAQKAGEPCRIMVATVPAGEAREVGRCRLAESSSIAWQPNSFWLYCTDDEKEMNHTSIFRLDLNSGSQTQIAVKTSIPQSVQNLNFSPDGKSLLYLWTSASFTRDIVVRDLSSGKEKTLGKNVPGTVSAAWSPDSGAVFVSTSNGLGSEVTVYPVDGGPPYKIYATVMNIVHLAAGGEGSLALETDTSRTNLARASASPSVQPDIIDPANGSTRAPTFAPDGTLAFISNRSGDNAVWIMKPGAAPKQLFNGGLSQMMDVRFSPDGSRLVLLNAATKGVTIKTMTASGAGISSFDMPTAGYGMPTWTPDSKEVLLFDRRVLQAFSFSVDNPAQRRPAAASPWSGLSIRTNGTFAIRIDKPGLWRIDKGERLLNAKYPNHWNPPIAFRGNDVLIPDFSAEDGPRILAQPVGGGPDRIVAYAPGARAQSAIAVNPKTGEVVYTAAVLSDSNIDLLTVAKH